MFLTETSSFPSFLDPFNKKNKRDVTKKFDLLSQSFDESLLRRLKPLTDPSLPISFSWLSSALDLLCFAHNEAITLLLPALKIGSSLNLYLDNSVQLLDLCNSITSEIERFRHRRLVLYFALHVLKDSNQDPEKLRRARVSLSEWISNSEGSRFGSNKNLEDLVRDLALKLKEVPRGKISAEERVVRRTIYAVGLVTVFVAGVVVAALRGSTGLGVAVRAPFEFMWADSFNNLNNELTRAGKKGYLLKELEDVEARIKEASGVIDDAKSERLNGAVMELERVTETLGEGLEGLSNGVNEVFNTVLSTRKGMLEKMRVGQQKQQTK